MKPFKGNRLNYMRILSEILYTLGTFLLLLIPFLEESQNLPYYKGFGWAVVVILIFVLVIEICSLLFVKKTKKEKPKEKKKRSNRIVPMIVPMI